MRASSTSDQADHRSLEAQISTHGSDRHPVLIRISTQRRNDDIRPYFTTTTPEVRDEAGLALELNLATSALAIPGHRPHTVGMILKFDKVTDIDHLIELLTQLRELHQP